MSLLRRLNPLTGLRDLRLFLASRQKHELIFAFLSVFVTVSILTAFYLDSGDLKREWKRDVTYIESWPLDRTDAEIIAAQKADAKTRAARDKAEKERRDKHRESLKRIDSTLERWGF